MAATVMGLSPQVASLIDQLDPSIHDRLLAVTESFTGNNGQFFRTADIQLSHFKGEMLALTDNKPSPSTYHS